MFNKKKIILIGLLVCVVLAAGAAVAYVKLSERNKDKVQIGVVNKYLKGYRDADLSLVRDTASDEMKNSLPSDQKKFKKMIEASNATNGKIKDWTINDSSTNKYVGQTMVDVTVTTTATAYNVLFDIVGSDEQGWKIRAVKKKGAAGSSPNMGGMGTQMPGGNHGM